MPTSITYQSIGANIHQGPGFLFWNILRPLYSMRPIIGPGNPPSVADPPAPGTWAATQAETVGSLIVDSNNNIQLVTTAGTTGSTQPTWNPIIGGTTTDGTVTWTNIGPSFVWKGSTPIIYDQQIRTAGGNIWQCILPGTSGSTQPPDTTPYGGIIQDGTALWMNLGPTLTLGSNEGALSFKMTPKVEPIQDDQHTAPVDFVTTGEDGEIDGTLMELNLINVSRVVPNTLYNTGSDPNFPIAAQNYNELTFGGQLRVPRPCVFLCSYRRQFGNSQSLSTNPFKYFGGALYAVGASSDGTLPFSLKKPTTYKVSCKASVVSWRPAGDQIGQFWEQI